MSNPFARCAICDGRIESLDPTGYAGWWAHEVHPADDHEAVPESPQNDGDDD